MSTIDDCLATGSGALALSARHRLGDESRLQMEIPSYSCMREYDVYDLNIPSTLSKLIKEDIHMND